ncbi:sulfatase-like hydrolase/transferase [Sorangium cellulosum]|nr:sulfatase-like hydrolase/transferase [Sorangium cellulosum]
MPRPRTSLPRIRLSMSRLVRLAAGRMRSIDELARCALSGIAVGLGAVAADTAARHDVAGVALAGHLRAAVGLYVAVGAGVGLAAFALVTLVRLLARPLARRAPRAAEAARAATYGLLAVAALSSTAFWAFSGRGAKAGALGTFGPYLALAAAGLVASAVAFLHGRAVRAADAGRAGGPAIAGALAVVGVALVIVDLTVLVAVYRRLHTALELSGAALLGCACFSALTFAARRAASAPAAIRALAAAAAAWALCLAASPGLRDWHEEALAHTGRDPVYVGRLLRRIELAQAVVRGEDVVEMRTSRLDDLRERYDVDQTTRDPRWDAGFRAPPAAGAAGPAERDLAADLNVLVYYVDSLRRDVAYDDEVMPNAAALSRQAIRFDRAYSTGSDTLRALPGLLGGSYDGLSRSPGSLLDLARRRGIPTTLFIPDSAASFLSQLLPAFSFDETHRLRDHARGGVWGYGADQPTAGPMVDHVLSWLAQRGSQRFFAWLFNFDVHNWHELDRTYVDGAAERYHVPDEGRWNWRYRVVARSLDEHFGRLLRGLEELELADRTVVLFVSDHGEALGYRGFWPHSTFLWESLVRVPLVLRVPGVPPMVVEENVSLVDVAPTMARLLAPDPPMNGYHGEDLLGYLDPEPPPRRLPLLAAAVSDQQIARVGIIDGRYKLVLPLEWGAPELYDLTAPDPDEADLSAARPRETLRLMSALLRSPVFLAAEAELERKRR